MEARRCVDCGAVTRDWYSRRGIPWCRLCWEILICREVSEDRSQPADRIGERKYKWQVDRKRPPKEWYTDE